MIGRITLPPQVFAGKWPPRRELLQPPANRPDFHWKPHGGLWTSTYTPDEEQPSEWLSWCAAEDFGWDKWQVAWVLIPVPALIYIIETMQDLNDLLGEFARPLPDQLQGLGVMRESLDWQAFGRRYDALWIPDPHEHRSQSMLLYGMDSESTWWARWSFKSKTFRLAISAMS